MNEDTHDTKSLPGAKIFQHVANLMGTSVADFHPVPTTDTSPDVILSELLSGQRQVEELDLNKYESETQTRMWVAPYIIVAGLIKGDEIQRGKIIKRMRAEDFEERSFARFVYDISLDCLRRQNEIPISQIADKIPDFGPNVLRRPLEGHLKLGIYSYWLQVLVSNLTSEQIEKAIDIVQAK